MHIARLKISGFRGVLSADISLGRHVTLVGPNNSGKTTIIEALALLFGRDRLVRRLTEHDFHGSAPDETARILCIATVTGFAPNDPHHHSSWFNPERGVEKWFDPNAKTLSALPDAQHTDLAVQIGFAARFDLDELEAETIRFFVDDEATLGDPFAEDAHLRTIHSKVLQELGFFLVPASRTWDKWISFSSELFRRVVATRGDMPAQAVRAERARLWEPPDGTRLEDQQGLSEIGQHPIPPKRRQAAGIFLEQNIAMPRDDDPEAGHQADHDDRQQPAPRETTVQHRLLHCGLIQKQAQAEDDADQRLNRIKQTRNSQSRR